LIIIFVKSICRESSTIISSLKVVLIFDDAFQKTSSTGFKDFPQGSETIQQGLDIFHGFMTILSSSSLSTQHSWARSFLKIFLITLQPTNGSLACIKYSTLVKQILQTQQLEQEIQLLTSGIKQTFLDILHLC